MDKIARGACAPFYGYKSFQKAMEGAKVNFVTDYSNRMPSKTSSIRVQLLGQGKADATAHYDHT